jgi:hypothetical protein
MVEVKKMHASMTPDPHIYSYVVGALKGSCTLGEAAAQARQFENEMNAWNVELDLREQMEVEA